MKLKKSQITHAKTELSKFFFRKTVAEKKKKTPPGALPGKAHAWPKKNSSVFVSQKKLRQLGFGVGYLRYAYFNVEVEDDHLKKKNCADL